MKKFFKSPWVIGIGTTVVGGVILSIVLDLIKEVSILSTLGTVIKTVWGWIISFLTFELKVWWVLLGIVVIIIVLLVISKVADSKEETLPKFLSYKEDKFDSWKWTWDWGFNRYDYKWHIKDLKAHCPKCDTPMFHDAHDTNFQCPRCSYKTDYRTKFKRRREVEAIIIDNLNRREENEEK